VIATKTRVAATKKGLLDAADGKLNAISHFLSDANSDADNASSDLERAQALLVELTQEIAPIAREESVTRVELAALKEAMEAADEAKAQWGVAAADGDPATGAIAILATAVVMQEQIAKQNKFHAARTKYAEDQREPVAAAKLAADAHVDELMAQIALQHAMMENAKKACKVAAFHHAVEELGEKRAVEAAKGE